MREVQSLQHRAAIQKALVGILRGRYLSRDSLPASAKIVCEGAPVPEEVIEDFVEELEDGAVEMDKASKVYLREEVARAS